jgi:hypothetical protein
LKNKESNKSSKLKTKQTTPIILKAVSFFLIFGSVIAISFYGFIFIFKHEILAEEIGIIQNPFVKPSTYILIETSLFFILIIGSIFLVKKSKKGALIITLCLISLFSMNYAYFLEIDWLNTIFFTIIMLILGFNWKKIK